MTRKKKYRWIEKIIKLLYKKLHGVTEQQSVYYVPDVYRVARKSNSTYDFAYHEIIDIYEYKNKTKTFIEYYFELLFGMTRKKNFFFLLFHCETYNKYKLYVENNARVKKIHVYNNKAAIVFHDCILEDRKCAMIIILFVIVRFPVKAP